MQDKNLNIQFRHGEKIFYQTLMSDKNPSKVSNLRVDLIDSHRVNMTGSKIETIVSISRISKKINYFICILIKINLKHNSPVSFNFSKIISVDFFSLSINFCCIFCFFIFILTLCNSFNMHSSSWTLFTNLLSNDLFEN